MKILISEDILKEKRDFLRENEIVFEILTIVKKALDIMKDYADEHLDDTYHPFDQELYAAYSIDTNARVTISKNVIKILIKELNSLKNFHDIVIAYYVTDYQIFVGDYSVTFKDYFDKLDEPRFVFHIGVPDNDDKESIIALLDIIIKEKDSKRVLIHELEHMLQDYRTNFKEYPYHEPDENRDKYFNQTSEIEAFLTQDIRQNIEYLLKRLKRITGGIKISPSEMRELIQNHNELTYKKFYEKNKKDIINIPQEVRISNKKIIKRFLKFADKEIKRAYIQTIQSFIK